MNNNNTVTVKEVELPLSHASFVRPNWRQVKTGPACVHTRDGLNGGLVARNLDDPKVAGWEDSHFVDEKGRVVFVSEQEAADAAANASMEQFHAENPNED